MAEPARRVALVANTSSHLGPPLQVPTRRLGTVDECAAFCMPFLDGTSGFTTGQFVAYAGGWV